MPSPATPGADVGVFLDRDGVLNRLVMNPATGDFESPHVVDDLEILPGVIPALQRLQARGVSLFVISNQPSAALGKTTIEKIAAIHARLNGELQDAGIHIRHFYYCYHHPRGTVAPYAGPCDCRKPSPYFLHEAMREYRVRAEASWMIGDRDVDVECGQRAGCRTILIECPESAGGRGNTAPSLVAADLPAAERMLQTLWTPQ